jgi:hypothetical protein
MHQTNTQSSEDDNDSTAPGRKQLLSMTHTITPPLPVHLYTPPTRFSRTLLCRPTSSDFLRLMLSE